MSNVSRPGLKQNIIWVLISWGLFCLFVLPCTCRLFIGEVGQESVHVLVGQESVHVLMYWWVRGVSKALRAILHV
jgi:hypothetical protein